MIESLTDLEYFNLAKLIATTFDDYNDIDDLTISRPKKFMDGISLDIKYHRTHDRPEIYIVRKLLLTDTDCTFIDTYGIINRSMRNDKMSKIVRKYIKSLEKNAILV